MLFRDFPLDVKDVGEDGAIEGFAATYGNVDRGGDVIMPGAFAKTLRGRKSMPMLLFHDQRRPIGVWTDFEDSTKGLKLKGRISVGIPDGAQAHQLAKDGALSALSIGYQTIKDRMTATSRELVELGLHEASLVTIPMNERAVVTAVKDLLAGGTLPTVREFEDFLRDAGGFSKTLAAAIAGKAAPHLRGDPEVQADPLAQLWAAIRNAPVEDLTGEPD
jgi:HK97 family phage prohead protease